MCVRSCACTLITLLNFVGASPRFFVFFAQAFLPCPLYQHVKDRSPTRFRSLTMQNYA